MRVLDAEQSAACRVDLVVQEPVRPIHRAEQRTTVGVAGHVNEHRQRVGHVGRELVEAGGGDVGDDAHDVRLVGFGYGGQRVDELSVAGGKEAP